MNCLNEAQLEVAVCDWMKSDFDKIIKQFEASKKTEDI